MDFLTIDNGMAMQADITVTDIASERRSIKIEINEGAVTPEGITTLQTIAGDSLHKTDILKRLGNIHFKASGKISNEGGNCIADIETDGGNMRGEFSFDRENRYKTTFTGTNINIGRISDNTDFAKCDIKIASNGKIIAETPEGEFSAAIGSLGFKDYTYSPLTINGVFNGKNITAELGCNDKNFHVKTYFALAGGDNHEIDAKIRIDSVKPGNLNWDDKKGRTLTATIEGKYYWNETGKSLLDARAYNITLATPDEKKIIRTLHITDNNPLQGERFLLLSSDFMDAKIAGHFTYENLTATFNNILHEHLPALGVKSPVKSDNMYSFRFDIKNTNMLSELLDLPVTINERSSIEGACDDNHHFFNFTVLLNNVDAGEHKYRNITAYGTAQSEQIKIDATLVCPQENGKLSIYDDTTGDTEIAFKATVADNHVINKTTWKSGNETDDNGVFGVDVALNLNRTGNLELNADIAPGKIVHNGTEWWLGACKIKGITDKYFIDDFSLNSTKKHLGINGTVGAGKEDKLTVSLKNIDLEEILNLVNFHSVLFGGTATGDLNLSSLTNTPQFDSKLNVENFTFEHGLLGNLDFSGGWNDESQSLVLRGDILGDENTHTIVSGFVSPANDTINLHIAADRTRLDFLNSMLKGIVSEINGCATGDIWVVGSLGKPNLAGAVKADGSFLVNTINTKYKMTGSKVKLVPDTIFFDHFEISDTYGHKGELSGSVNHKHLGNFTCELGIKAENLLAYNSSKFGDFPFYGTAFVTGNAGLSANEKGIFLHANVRNDKHTRFVYDAGNIGEVTNKNFITFTDKNKKQQTKTENKEKPKLNNLLSRLNLEFVLDITQEMELKVFTNVKTDDYISIYGNGPVVAVYDEKEGFSMKGKLDLTRGTYKFTMQDLFLKEFDIMNSSTLTFDGDPFDAELNLQTKYTVQSASLSDLDPDGKRHRSVKVNCLMDIAGKLDSPQLNFDIELPDATQEERELLASTVNTPDQKNMQFIYLLGIGKFYTYDYNQNSSDTQSSSAMESLISNTVSGQLNNMLSQIIDNKNWNISGNFSSSERGWNSMEVEGILEGRLLDNRLLINGNFGYRENALANTNFISEFEVQWLLDKNGNVSLKAYNKTNDRYFSDATLTTQGAGIILRHDFERWRWWLRNAEKKQEKEITEK